jgi:hypothetical protein
MSFLPGIFLLPPIGSSVILTSFRYIHVKELQVPDWVIFAMPLLVPNHLFPDLSSAMAVISWPGSRWKSWTTHRACVLMVETTSNSGYRTFIPGVVLKILEKIPCMIRGLIFNSLPSARQCLGLGGFKQPQGVENNQ